MSDSEDRRPLELIETRWSLIRRAHMESSSSFEEARAALVLRYAAAIRNYIARMTRDEETTDEIAQDVVVRLMKGDFAGADPTRGRFRDLMKTAVRNMVRDFWARRKRRRTVDYDVAGVEQIEEHGDDGPWIDAWTKSILDLTWSALKEHERARSGRLSYTVLRMRTRWADDSSEQLAARLTEKLGRPIRADFARQQLRRARVRFAELLLAEIADGLDRPTPDQVEEELIALGLLEYVRGVLPADWKEKLLQP